MALQTGVSSAKVLILVGAGLTGSVVVRSGRLSDIIAQLQDLLKGVNDVELSPQKYDTAILAAQIRQLAQEIRELTVSNPVTILNGNSSSGSISSYLVPAAAIGAMGYCYMWWKGLSLSDVMFVTKHNMANAVATVSKQLENVSDVLTATRKHLSKRLESLDWKLQEQEEISKLISNDVNELNSNLSRIGFDVGTIHEMLAGLEGKVDLIESKQEMTNSGIWYLCEVAGASVKGAEKKTLQDITAKLPYHPTLTCEDASLKGLQFIAETKDSSAVEKSIVSVKTANLDNSIGEKLPSVKNRIHRSYPVGISLTRNVIGTDL